MTICTYKRKCIFGEILDDEMKLSEFGKIVSKVWNAIPEHFENVELDQFVVMPNHVHGIIIINESNNVRAWHANQSFVGTQGINQTFVKAQGIDQSFVRAWHAMPLPKADIMSVSKADTMPLQKFGKPISSSLSVIVGSFKSAVTKFMHVRGYNDRKIWHRNYYEHIIKKEKELNEIRKYIANNPASWAKDEENPNAL